MRATMIGRTVAVALTVLLVSGFAAQAKPLAPAAAFGPVVAVGKLEGGYVGRLALQPDHGPAGTAVTVSASGLPANQTFDLVWRTVKGRWKVADAKYNGRRFVPVAYRIARVKTDADGRFAASFTAPRDFGFSHDILLQRDSRLFTQTGFSIDMTVTLSPHSGPLGTPITVNVKGIGWRHLHNSWLLLYDNKFTGWISSVTTGGSARFTIPAVGKPGTHVIEVIHGAYTFPYRNVQQSPEPNRPQFMRRFVVTAGAPVLPPAPSAQGQAKVRRLPPQGALAATPAFGIVGTPVVVKGEGFAPGKTLKLDWTTVTGNRVGGSGWQESSRVIAAANADGSGKVVFHFKAPDDLGGAHRLAVADGGGRNTGSFWIAPSAAALSVARGPAGTPFKIHLKGVGWTETANIYTIVYDNGYIGYACGFNSQGDVVIPLYATGAPGWHFVDLYPAIYKGKERSPRNFRIPQLTYAADHPGEDLPRFRFAFHVTGSASPAPSAAGKLRPD